MSNYVELDCCYLELSYKNYEFMKLCYTMKELRFELSFRAFNYHCHKQLWNFQIVIYRENYGR